MCISSTPLSNRTLVDPCLTMWQIAVKEAFYNSHELCMALVGGFRLGSVCSGTHCSPLVCVAVSDIQVALGVP